MRPKIRGLVWAAGLAAAACLPGCNIAGPVAYLIHGPEKVDRVFQLDEKKTTVVFVDDSNSRLPSRSLRGEVADAVEKYLLREGCVKDMIQNRYAIQAATADRSGEALSITEIGQRVSAEVVVYVEIEDFGISPDGQSFAPFAKARVKVMDVKESKRVWPPKAAGHPVVLQPQPQPGKNPSTMTERLEASRLLANEVGKAVAQLFYTHELNNAAGSGELKKANEPYSDPS